MRRLKAVAFYFFVNRPGRAPAAFYLLDGNYPTSPRKAHTARFWLLNVGAVFRGAVVSAGAVA